jgi:hypothetical protein
MAGSPLQSVRPNEIVVPGSVANWVWLRRTSVAVQLYLRLDIVEAF